MDTNIFIHIQKHRDAEFGKSLLEFVEASNLGDCKICISAITNIELFTNKDNDTCKGYDLSLAKYESIPVDDKIATNGANISNAVEYFRDKKVIPREDAIIAATAFTHDLYVMTTDINDFCAPLYTVVRSFNFVKGKDFTSVYILDPDQSTMEQFKKNCGHFVYDNDKF